MMMNTSSILIRCSVSWLDAGLPSRYRDSVRAIRPGLPLFLYNYSTHQLHGIFEVHYNTVADSTRDPDPPLFID